MKCRLLFESTVMDGAPVFSLARCGLKGCQILGFRGILNSTTNVVLTRMEAGESMGGAVAEAQQAGFAEADPAHDLQGWDSAAKTAVLANALMGASLTPFQVKRQGIEAVTRRDLEVLRGQGKRLKLICEASFVGGEISACVGPQAVGEESLLARCKGTGGLLEIQTDLMGPLVIVQQNPSLRDTAYGVLNDLLTIQQGSLSGTV
jgi:homoserine dehydrogenase